MIPRATALPGSVDAHVLEQQQHSSPTDTGKVMLKPPAPSVAIGTVTNWGNATSSRSPFSSMTASKMAACTITVDPAGESTPMTIPGMQPQWRRDNSAKTLLMLSGTRLESGDPSQ
jgi:hypothetical protein